VSDQARIVTDLALQVAALTRWAWGQDPKFRQLTECDPAVIRAAFDSSSSSTPLSPREALEQAIAECGTATEFARRCNTTVQHVYNWRQRGIPAERVRDAESACGGKITRYDLRPDVFGPAPSAGPQTERAAA